MIYALVGCLIIIGFLGFKLFQKQKIDKEVLDQYNLDIDTAKTDLHELIMQQRTEIQRVAQYKTEYKQYKQRAEEYQDLINNKFTDIDNQIEEQRQKRQADLDTQFEERQASLNLRMQQFTNQAQERVNKAEEEAREQIEELEKRKLEAINNTNTQIEKFESILEVLRKYDLEQQERLFYTIQLPEEYQEDIEFLLTTVAAKVQHPDIISKLVWVEYVKPNLDDTFKRIEIKTEPGIYKLTSLVNGKCYIGKSTNVKTRISDHFKSAIGIKSIADQAVHHAILKEGFWNWQIEIITYCDKEQLSELEKYYIEFFKSQEFGYNKNAGG